MKLLKPHGSINWYFAGDENVPGQQVFYMEVGSKTPSQDLSSNVDEDESGSAADTWVTEDVLKTNKKDLIPLIIPPVAEKSAFYGTKLVRVLWTEFKRTIQEASEIYCVGYSMPKTDLTVRIFLSTAADYYDKAIHIVNDAKDEKKRRLIENYSEVFRRDAQELGDNYIDSLRQMVNMLVRAT